MSVTKKKVSNCATRSPATPGSTGTPGGKSAKKRIQPTLVSIAAVFGKSLLNSEKSKPETKKSKPETEKSKPETEKPKPETEKSKTETEKPKTETDKSE